MRARQFARTCRLRRRSAIIARDADADAMNGIHDMGGMDGFGAVMREANEPVFHADWERRVFAMNLGLAGLIRKPGVVQGGSFDEPRHAIERIPPARYLASSYYERWLLAVETLLVEHGLIGRDELAARLGVDANDVAISVPAARVDATAESRVRSRARFHVGDRVRARNLNVAGHTRLPRYVRGRLGLVRRDWGVFVFPDTNAHHAGERPQHVYCVEFTARELWQKPASARERVFIDLWEDYLEPAAAKPKRKTGARGRRR
jgi:nitrile hydratase subunit beta